MPRVPLLRRIGCLAPERHPQWFLPKGLSVAGECKGFGGQHRLTYKISLTFRTSVFAQIIQLLLRFDTLSDDTHVEICSKPDD